MIVERPAGTKFSRSRQPGGGSSPLLRGEDNRLQTQAVLFPDDTEDDLDPRIVAALAVGLAAGAVAVKAAPLVAATLRDLRSRMSRKRQTALSAAKPSTGAEEPPTTMP